MPLASLVQSHVRYPLTNLLGSAGNLRVLRALVADRSPQSVPQLVRQSGLSGRGVRLVLESLIQQQVVVAHGSGRTHLYALSDAHPFSGAIAALFHDEAAHWERLLASVRDVLSVRANGVRAAWLYGSVARGEDTPTSDLDMALLVTSAAVTDRVREDLMAIEDKHRIRIMVAGLTEAELATLPDDDPWWSDVVRDARVLKGPAPDAVKRRLARTVK